MLISGIVFFGDWLIAINVVPPQFMWIQELLAVTIFIKSISTRYINKNRIEFIGEKIIVVFLAVCLLSAYINKTELISIVLFLRLILRYYLLFLGIINLDWEEKRIKIFNNFVFALIAIQIPVSIIKFFIYGQNERAIGTYAWHGGVPSTVLPLVVIGFCLSYFLLYKKTFIFILLILGFITFSMVGGKRAFIFYLPLLIIFLSWYLKENIKNLFRYVIVGSFVFMIALYFTLSFVPSLSPGEHEKSGFSPSYAFNYAKEYTTLESEGVSYGRIATFIKVFKILVDEGKISFLFGKGPGNVLKTRFETFDTRNRAIEEFNVGYGISGITWLAMNVGYLGALVFLLLLLLIMRKCIFLFKIEKDPYWRSFGLGMIGFSFVIIVISLSYANIAVTDLFAVHYFCFSSFIILRINNLDMLHEKTDSYNNKQEEGEV